MFPTLFHIGPVVIHTYGVLVALGMALGLLWSLRSARRFGLEPGMIQDLTFYIILTGIIGSRLWFVGIAWDHFKDHPLDILKFWQGGLVFYGGLVPAIFAAIAYLKIKGQPVFTTGDALAPGLALGQAVGRLGCFTAGCCYGAPSDAPWAVTFSHQECLAPLGVALHPTQLYAAGGLLAIFLITAALQKYRSFPGQVFWTYGLLHGLFRPVLEFFRSDFRGDAFLFGLNSTQFASLCMALVSAVILIYLYLTKRSARNPSESS